MRFPLALLLLLLAAAAPASAAETAAKPDTSQQTVNISPVAAPIVVNGRLVNYVFVAARLVLTPRADAIKLRDKEPYLRDALVRAAHRHPFVKPGDYIHVDEAAVVRTLMQEGTRIAGPGQIAKVEIVSAQPRRVRGLTNLPPSGAAGGERLPTP